MEKIMKKLVAVVATVAMCSSVVAPVSAKATTCPPHYFVYEIREFLGGMYDHPYLYSETEELDGSISLDYRTCYVDIMVTETKKVCTKCRRVESTDYEEEEHHRVNHN